MDDTETVHVRLSEEDDVAAFRERARRLLSARVAPHRVDWSVASRDDAGLFDEMNADRGQEFDRGDAMLERVQVPASFVALCEQAALHAEPGRFALLYRGLWRLVHEPQWRHDPLDADRMLIEQLARAVRRDIHKMTAFVRFRPLAVPSGQSGGDQTIQHIAWFEPEHHVVRAAAPFFARRFAQMTWAILTPRRSVRWDGHRLAFGPGANKADAPGADAAEHLWLTYYASIFNPARLKLAMMQKEMPRRYWKNLPEAVLIAPLAARAAERSGRMIEQAPSQASHRRPAASTAWRLDQRPRTAHAADTLDALHDGTERCRACPIGALATQAVNGAGPIAARLMIVGEQPGDREDLSGQPFVGPAGQLLDRALARLGWPRESLYLTNAVKHFKFELRGKRRIHKTPAQREIAACVHWLEEEIALVRPMALIALGATAARALLDRAIAVSTHRGQWLSRPDGRNVLITLHPAALLRLPPADQGAAFEQWVSDLRLADTHAIVGSGSGQ